MTVRLAGVRAPCYSEGWDTWREGVARSFLPIAIKANYAREYLALVRPIAVMGARWELPLRKKGEGLWQYTFRCGRGGIPAGRW